MHLARKLCSVANIDKLSTVHRGNAFEERCLKILQGHLSMRLRRVGGKSDGGVDLQGWWWLPPALESGAVPSSSYVANSGEGPAGRRRLRIFAQCKAEKKKFSPNYVREMEGVLHRYLSSSKVTSASDKANGASYPLVALLLSESPFTASTFLRAQSSPVPFFLLHIPLVSSEGEFSDTDGREAPQDIGTAFWNPALGGQHGILGGHIEARWERAVGGGGRPGLWFRENKIRNWTPDEDHFPEVEDGFEVPGL